MHMRVREDVQMTFKRLLEKLRFQQYRLRRRFFPDMRDRFLPSRRVLAATARSQLAYSERFLRHVEWLQCHAGVETAAMHLTYFPIAKNLRGLGTAIYRNVDLQRRTVIAPGNDAEEESLRAEGGPAWRPWLWSRIPRGQLHNLAQGVDDPELGWPTYFLAPTQASEGAEATACSRPPWLRGDAKTDAILRIAACTRYAFRPNANTRRVLEEWKSQIGWDDDEPKLGIHLRRGDAATEDLQQQTRRSYPLEAYLATADRLCRRYGLRTLYLSTESELEIERAQTLRPRYRFLWLHHDRSVFPRIGEASGFIEDVAFADPSVIEPLVHSAIADLWLLQSCSAFIGTFNSEFSVLAWLLCIGNNGHVIPYVNLAKRSDIEYWQGSLEFRLGEC
jgi:hypothetical protein